jgi:serine/threonine protein kinase
MALCPEYKAAAARNTGALARILAAHLPSVKTVAARSFMDKADPILVQGSVAGLASGRQPVVPDYELLKRIGKGAFGEVWLARNKATGILRAVKIVWRNTFEEERPYQREFEGLLRFERISQEHPSQLKLLHVGRNDGEGYFYYVMELADGAESPKSEVRGSKLETTRAEREAQRSNSGTNPHAGFDTTETYKPRTLRADLAKGRLPTENMVEIGLALAEALGHLHQQGLVHRDVKPSNVIFVNGRPKLADIGLVTDANDNVSLVGTEGYLLADSLGKPQGDIFALGKVLYEGATGFDRLKYPELPQDLRKWPDAEQVFELNEIILKACASDAQGRYASVATLLSDLQLLQRGESVKRSRRVQWFRTVWKRVGIGLAAFATIGISIVVLVQELASSPSDPDGPQSKKSPVANVYCDKGLKIIRSDNYAELPEAYTNFQKAIALDPEFARPYIGLMEMGLREPVPASEATDPETMRGLAAKLKKLAPHLGATAVAQSIVSYYDWDFPAAERFAKQATKASPSYELGHTWYAHMLTMWERPVEARQELEKSRSLVLSKAVIYRGFGHSYFVERDFTNALKFYSQAVEYDQHHEHDFFHLGRTLRAMGDFSGSISNVETGALANVTGEKEREAIRIKYQSLRNAFADRGVPGYWEQGWNIALAELKPDEGLYRKAVIQIQLGHTNDALRLLEQSYEARERIPPTGDCALNYLLFDEYWDQVRDDKRFKQLLDEIGFPKVMRKK